MAERRKKGTGTVRKRKDGRWESLLTVGFDEQGKAIRKNVLGKTRTECLEKLKVLQENSKVKLGKAPIDAKPSMRFGEWLDMWFNTYSKPNIRESTAELYANRIYQHIIPEIGHIQLNKLTQSDIQGFYNNLKTSGRQKHEDIFGDGLSDMFVRGCHANLNSSLKKAVELNLIYKNPATGCKLPKKKAAEMKVLTHNEIYKMLIQAKYDGCYELFLLALTTGLRRGELVGLKWSDINLITGELQVKRQVDIKDGQVVEKQPKTKSAIRIIMLPPIVIKTLIELKKSTNSQWVFPSPVKNDSPIHPKSLYKKTCKILEKAGCKRIRFHDLRHTYATISLESGMDVKTLSSMLGHMSADTTLDIYSHMTQEMQSIAANKIEIGIQKENAKIVQKTEQKIEKFEPTKNKIRKSGTGCVYKKNDNLYEGKYSPTNAQGQRERYNVYAKTEEECEEKLQELIKEVKARIEKEKGQLKNGQ